MNVRKIELSESLFRKKLQASKLEGLFVTGVVLYERKVHGLMLFR